MSLLLITHYVGQAYYVSDRAGVMKKGRIVEFGLAGNVFLKPEQEYAKDLAAGVPKLHEKWEITFENQIRTPTRPAGD